MLSTLIQSAFRTGHLSVESEGLMRQVLDIGSCTSADMQALEHLYTAVQTGTVQREARQQLPMPVIRTALAHRWLPR